MSLEKTVADPGPWEPAGRVPLPPPKARMQTTACDYCAVGCGYRVYTWPVGQEGGPRARENAFGVDFPRPPLKGWWFGPNQHTVVLVGGEPQHALVLPDPEATVVNPGGNHSFRGGAIAQKCYSPRKPTRDRLKTPLLRVRGELVPVSWDAAMTILAGVSRRVLERHGELRWGMKTYSYQFFENTYAISKLAFDAIQTPCYAYHDSPSIESESAGLIESGLQTFGASYRDLGLAQVLFLSGSDPFETKTVLFTSWLKPRGGRPAPALIVANPRRTMGAAWAEKNGGLWLAVEPGTDSILHMAVARLILERGWEDAEFLARWSATPWEIDSGMGRGSRDTPWQWRTTWRRYGGDYASYRSWLLGYAPAALEEAARRTGVPAERIARAAALLTGAGGERPRASFAFEKGNYWSNNYANTASYAALAMLCGAGNRSGRVVCRLGGHQRGWASMAAPYPIHKSPEKLPGRRRKPLDLDKWVEAGQLRFAWVIGTTWVQAMAASDELGRRLRELVRVGEPVDSAEPQRAIARLSERADAGGLVLAHQDLYLRDPIGAELADLVLPAAGWGEEDFTRANAERRLRLYPRFYDPPGEARADWRIIADFARRMGFAGFDWKDSSAVFEEGARFSRGTLLDYYPVTWYAKETGISGHELLRRLGTTGIQCPVRYRTEPTEGAEYLAYAGSYRAEGARGALVGTLRVHDPETDFGAPEGPTIIPDWLTAFATHGGRLVFHKSPWEDFEPTYAALRPGPGELWVVNGRVGELWQSLYDDQRRPYALARWPDNLIELHPEDAAERGIAAGDRVAVESESVLVQTGGFIGAGELDLGFESLQKAGLVRRGRGAFEAVAIVTPSIRRGVSFAYFLWPSAPANALAPRLTDPVTSQYRFKLAKGRVRRLGASPYASDLSRMSLLRRDLL